MLLLSVHVSKVVSDNQVCWSGHQQLQFPNPTIRDDNVVAPTPYLYSVNFLEFGMDFGIIAC